MYELHYYLLMTLVPLNLRWSWISEIMGAAGLGNIVATEILHFKTKKTLEASVQFIVVRITGNIFSTTDGQYLKVI